VDAQSDAPLLVNPKPSWHKLSWFAEFIASIPNYRDNTIATARLAIAAREHLFAWAKAEGWTLTSSSKASCTSTATRPVLTTRVK
jgi:transposase